ncbi:zinc-ribbon domain-containing protein [Pseudoalteromonas sp. ACER1]|uniref:Zinc-ribbon domain containing protein n=1 Tax=Pseudoalteromonas lipolytica TaxID=570156 RepID=A0ABU8SR10_9GAMM|nr:MULTISPECIES: zinc-ribbon domain containing protein [unclassified Pseudoalteromonas]MCF2846819.1 zinc-ribbon domain-containing protein [Pseudoalteromonas sp. PAST1]MCO7210419.1 zinc-ribbon domain-containing protein [Pseudoalteromonas sp. ACER1]TMP18012.1 hypothetical protein CWC02_11120 [Pseudoalteromonas sp. S2721]
MSLYVNHPRYGCKPIRSGYQYSVTEIKNSYWRYKHVKFLVGTAIPANTEKQNYGVYPREKYIDIEELCEVCNRPFIFFALEQKYWFEVLRFYIDAHCTKCIDCRKNEQKIKRLQKSYCDLVTNKNRTSRQNETLKKLFVELTRLGIIKHKNNPSFRDKL